MRIFFYVLTFLFVINLTTSYGQLINIDINSQINDELQLTNITENVDQVIFEIHPDYTFKSIVELECAGQYFFLHAQLWEGSRNINDFILQYTTAGKFVRAIGLKEGYNSLRNIVCDTINNLLYLSSGDKDKTLLIYDFDGKLINKYDSFSEVNSYVIFKNILWREYSTISDDRKTMKYTFSRFDSRNMSEQKIYQFNDDEGVIGNTGVGFSTNATYSTFKNDLYVSFGAIDNLIHKMQGNTLVPSVKINITPKSSEMEDRFPTRFRGFIGSYLFINYSIKNKPKLFIYNTNTKKGYNFTDDNSLKNQGVWDNIYGTGYITKLSKLNRSGYFYFVRSAGELKEMPKGVSDKSHPIVYVAKIKE